jgi:hypothetical protein
MKFPCKFEGCDKPVLVKEYCNSHYRQNLEGKKLTPLRGYNPGEWTLNSRGYLVRTRNGKQEKQHRVVMEEVIGRPLKPYENIHHKNGDRADNRIENLELWNTSQPSGQRVVDLWHYALEILNDVGPLVADEVLSLETGTLNADGKRKKVWTRTPQEGESGNRH